MWHYIYYLSRFIYDSQYLMYKATPKILKKLILQFARYLGKKENRAIKSIYVVIFIDNSIFYISFNILLRLSTYVTLFPGLQLSQNFFLYSASHILVIQLVILILYSLIVIIQDDGSFINYYSQEIYYSPIGQIAYIFQIIKHFSLLRQ